MGGEKHAEAALESSRVFQGGNWNHLHSMLQLQTGSALLYVGDHMYSDILRSKRTLGWRTLLIVPELDDELAGAAQAEALAEVVDDYRVKRGRIEAACVAKAMERLRLEEEADDAAAAELEAELTRLREEQEELTVEINLAISAHHDAFHPQWGRLFKAGHQNSRWAQQVQEYACLYTSRVTNLAHVAPDVAFHALSDLMPHDRDASERY